MTQFVGRHLEEMADIRSSRKRKIVLLCSLVSILVMASYGLTHLAANNYPFAALNLICSLVLSLNLWYMYRIPVDNHADLILSGVLLFDAIVLLLYGEQIPDRLLWLFPIVAAVIFINEFRIGLIFSGAFCLLATFSTLFTDAILVPAYMSTERFIVSLIATTLLCNTFSFYYGRMVSYIQSLYQEGIEDLAYMDQLTGLANRWSFENWALEKLSEVQDHSTITALVFLDIDNFKSINDTYGHDVGDRVLQHFSKRLQNNVRSKDRKTNKHDYSIARFAGDEFVLLLYDVRSKQDLDNILHRICHLFEDSYQASERINRLTISVGVALYPQDADSLPELTRCADKAMYAAKHGGKNQYRYYRGDRLSPLKEIDLPFSAKVTPIKKR